MPAIALTPKQQAAIKRTPTMYRGNFMAVLLGKASPRRAIKAKCLDCSGWIRADVADCRILECALWLHRPYQVGADDALEELPLAEGASPAIENVEDDPGEV